MLHAGSHREISPKVNPIQAGISKALLSREFFHIRLLVLLFSPWGKTGTLTTGLS